VSQQFHPPTGPDVGSRPDPTLGHEERDIAVRPIALTIAGLLVVVIAVFVFIQILLNVLAGVQSRRSAAPSPLAGAYGMKEPPAPRLQTDPVADLQELRARDQALLSGYAWVDRDGGVVRLPIERAIDVLAARGLPARTPRAEAKP
jgi:hypothetical protein